MSCQVIILRGWVYGIDDNELNKCYQELIKELRKKNYQLVIWDGDLDKPDSFTSLISRLMKDKEFTYLKFLAFKHYQWINDLKKGYKEDDHGVESRGYEINDSQFLYAKDIVINSQWIKNKDGLFLPNKKLTVIGFHLGEGKKIDWNALSLAGLEFTISQLKVKKATMMTIGEGKVFLSELLDIKNFFLTKSLDLELIRLQTQRRVGDKIEYVSIS